MILRLKFIETGFPDNKERTFLAFEGFCEKKSRNVPLTNGSVAQVKLGASLVQVAGAAIFRLVDGAV